MKNERIIYLMRTFFFQVAQWSDTEGLQQIPPNYKRIPQNTGFENKTYVVTSILVYKLYFLKKNYQYNYNNNIKKFNNT